MKNIVLFLLLLSCSVNKNLSNTDVRVKEVLYLEVDIRNKDVNPILISGITSEINFDKLLKLNENSFIESFYKQAIYTPDFLVYDTVITEYSKYVGDKKLMKYLGNGQKLMNLVNHNSRETKILLNNGGNVFINITKIKGTFIKFDKNDFKLTKISNGLNIDEFQSIREILLPLDIESYTKPSRKFVKKLNSCSNK